MLFSGHRRRGDVQESFEQLDAQACFPHYGLSVDVVISMQWGNLLKDEERNFFLRAIKETQVASTIAGPPHETWSKAREEYYRNHRGPRPVRTRESPWGMSCMKLKELAQVKIGNLLLFVIQFAYVPFRAGAFMTLEHPQNPLRKANCMSLGDFSRTLCCAEPQAHGSVVCASSGQLS